MHNFTGLIAGLIFGTGLALSGMLDPSKVAGFLNITGLWDPSLAFVMGGGVVANAIGYALIRRRSKPVLAETFTLPETNTIDQPLIVGAAVFGIGWGMAGLCPGPAVASLIINPAVGVGFMLFLIIGLKIGSHLKTRL